MCILSCLLNTADMYSDVDLCGLLWCCVCGLLRWIDVCALLWSNLEGDTQLAECWAERQDTTGDQTRYVQVCSVGSARGAHGGCFRRLMTSHDVMTCLAVCHMSIMYSLLISHNCYCVSRVYSPHVNARSRFVVILSWCSLSSHMLPLRWLVHRKIVLFSFLIDFFDSERPVLVLHVLCLFSATVECSVELCIIERSVVVADSEWIPVTDVCTKWTLT